MLVRLTTTRAEHKGAYVLWIERHARHLEALRAVGFVFAEEEAPWWGSDGQPRTHTVYRIQEPIARELTLEQLVALAGKVGEIIVRRDGVLEIYDDHRE